MGNIRVTAAQLRSSASDLESLNSQFKSAVGELESLEGTLRSSFEGEASDAFHTAFTNDKTQMNNFYNAILAYVQALNSLAEKYARTESSNVEIARTRNYQ